MSNTAKTVIGIAILIILVVVVVSVLNKSAPNPSAAGSETIKIGYFGPFTGPVAGTTGEDIGNGWKFAVAKRPILAGKKVEMIYEDDACDPKKAASAANKLISIDKVKILVNGVCSGSMIAAMPIAAAAKAILFTPVSTSPKITDGGDYVFRTSASSVHTAKAMSDIIAKFGWNSVAVLFENAEYTVGLKDALLKNLSDAGVKITLSEGVSSQESDMRTSLSKIAVSKPQVLVVIMNSTVTASSFVKQNKELGLKLPVIGNEYFAYNQVVSNPDAENMYASQYKYDSEAAPLKSFLSDYFKTYNKNPSQDIYAALPFDGYNVLANAIEKCDGDSDTSCIRDALYATRGYQGITGTITIDKNGDTEREFTVRQIKGGKLVDVK